MALVKIYTISENKKFLDKNFINSAKKIFGEALNCSAIPTTPDNIEIVYSEGLDLAGIDFIIEIIACERPKLETISQDIIYRLNEIYPDKLFSVYFNLIQEEGMAHTPRTR